MMLADQDANVNKVEPLNGELMRRLSHGRNGISAFFMSCSRNKRSIGADLKSAQGLEIVRKRIAADSLLNKPKSVIKEGCRD
jgi:formyl-CoA transferase